jgi:sugar phosphate permease
MCSDRYILSFEKKQESKARRRVETPIKTIGVRDEQSQQPYGGPPTMTKLFYILTILGAFLGAAVLIIGLIGANGAPQQAAAGAVACAFAVIPYVIARAFQELR